MKSTTKYLSGEIMLVKSWSSLKRRDFNALKSVNLYASVIYGRYGNKGIVYSYEALYLTKSKTV